MRKRALKFLLTLTLLMTSLGAVAGCREFVEDLPMEVGGGCVIFTICCYGSYCEVTDVADHPGWCPG